MFLRANQASPGRQKVTPFPVAERPSSKEIHHDLELNREELTVKSDLGLGNSRHQARQQRVAFAGEKLTNLLQPGMGRRVLASKAPQAFGYQQTPGKHLGLTARGPCKPQQPSQGEQR